MCSICASHIFFWNTNQNKFQLLMTFLSSLHSVMGLYSLTHWGWVTHIWASKVTFIGSDSSLLPDRRQAIIWTYAGILLIGPLGTNFGEISIKIHTFLFKKMHLKMSSAKWQQFCLGLNVLSGKTSYHQISLSLEAARLGDKTVIYISKIWQVSQQHCCWDTC